MTTNGNGHHDRAALPALGYVRRSKESGARSVSLEDQRARIAAYCAERGWSLAEIVQDDGVSGGRRQRLERIAERVQVTGARAVVVYAVDRFARDVAALLDTLRGYSRRGVELHAVGRGHVEVESEAGFLLTGVEGLMAEAFRRSVSRKTKDALARLRQTGRRYSNVPPYGWRVSADGRRLEPEPVEAARLTLIRELTTGRSLRALSRELAARGVVARGGRPFDHKLLSRLVRAGDDRSIVPIATP